MGKDKPSSAALKGASEGAPDTSALRLLGSSKLRAPLGRGKRSGRDGAPWHDEAGRLCSASRSDGPVGKARKLLDGCRETREQGQGGQ